jgi:hypothetical protein
MIQACLYFEKGRQERRETIQLNYKNEVQEERRRI